MRKKYCLPCHTYNVSYDLRHLSYIHNALQQQPKLPNGMTDPMAITANPNSLWVEDPALTASLIQESHSSFAVILLDSYVAF